MKRASASAGCFIKADGSNIVDLTHQWHVGMSELPFFAPFVHTPFHTIERDGIRSARTEMMESCGTHCEAPGHVLAGAPTIEQIPPASLIGPAVVVDVRTRCAADHDYKLSIADLEAWETRNGRIPDGAWLVMLSGWGDRWNTPEFLNLDGHKRDHYPGFDPAAAAWLVANDRHVTGIATECYSPEGGTAARGAANGDASSGRMPALPVRRALLPVWGTLVVANLANAALLPERGAWLIVGVLGLRGGGGAQARVLGVLPDGS